MSVKWELHCEGTFWSGQDGKYDYPVSADVASYLATCKNANDVDAKVHRIAGDFQSVLRWKVMMTQTHVTVTEMASFPIKRRKRA